MTFYESKAGFVRFSKHISNQLKNHKLTWATPFGPIQDPIAFSSLLTIDNWWTPNKADLSSANKGKMSKYWSDASDGLHRKSRPEKKIKINFDCSLSGQIFESSFYFCYVLVLKFKLKQA